jgi:HK97 family phage prohead protease/HK97 family phage major capsid protein
METPMKLTFSHDITCNAEERTITGKIVPFGNEVGYTSAGKVVFKKGSIEIPDSPKPKLLLEHDAKKPIGRMVSYEETDEGIYATFKVSNTTRGNDALIEASEQLRSGLSVGVEVIDSKREGGVIKVIASRMYETSLVQAAAFKSAEVLSVAASEDEVVETPTQNESEAVVENTPDTATVAPVVETPAVEAARPTVAAPIYAKPRINVTPLTMLENTIKANIFNDEDARQWIRAASDTDTTTDVPGLVPTRQLTEVWNPKSTGTRATIEAISSGTLPDAGMKFQIPRVKSVPGVGAPVAEGGAFTDDQVEIEYLDVDVKKAAGMQLFSVEVLDRTSPAFLSELLALMGDAYAKSTNTAAGAALATGGTLDATTTTLPWDGAEIASFIARAGASIYTNTFRFATGVIVSPTQWSNLTSLVDSQNRPIFNAAAPQNAAGDLSVSAIRGTLLGLPLYVDYTMSGDADNSIIVVNRDSYTWYESPRLQLRAEKVGTGKVEIGMYGYYAIATKTGAGAFRFNKA